MEIKTKENCSEKLLKADEETWLSLLNPLIQMAMQLPETNLVFLSQYQRFERFFLQLIIDKAIMPYKIF